MFSFLNVFWLFFQEKPDSPQNVKVTCNGTSANIQWTSSFEGGFPQTFIALALYKEKDS